MNIKLDDKITFGIIAVLIALFSIIFLGFTGLKVLFGMLLVFFLPFYLILDSFELSRSEKIIFSFFIGIGVFSSITYWIGVLVSFKIAIVITFVLLLVIAFIVRRMKGGKKANEGE